MQIKSEQNSPIKKAKKLKSNLNSIVNRTHSFVEVCCDSINYISFNSNRIINIYIYVLITFKVRSNRIQSNGRDC